MSGQGPAWPRPTPATWGEVEDQRGSTAWAAQRPSFPRASLAQELLTLGSRIDWLPSQATRLWASLHLYCVAQVRSVQHLPSQGS